MQSPLTEIFDTGLLQEIEKHGQWIKVPAGASLMEVGQTIRVMPIVISGSIRVSSNDEQGRELLLYYITANEGCALTFSCCMEHNPSEIKAAAEDDVELVAIPVSVMDEWLVKYPTWKSFVLRTIRLRFNEIIRAINQIAFQKLDERLVTYLKEKSATTGSAVVHLSHEQIAQDLATSRVVISRLLKKLEHDKKLILYRNEIKLLKGL